jgi:hypothetical protein
MADTLIGTGIVDSLKKTVQSLDKALAEESGELTPREQTQTLLAIAKGVLMTIDNHYSCPALQFYEAFRKWVLPVMFGLVVAAFAGGLYAFQAFGVKVPAP